MGFLLLGLALGSFDGIKASLIYLLIYIVMNTGLFIILLNTYNVYTNRHITFLTDFHYFAKNNWLISVSLVIILFSMAGIPPLAGFFGKYYLFLNAFSSKYYSLVIIGMLTSMVSTFYYLKLIKFLWFAQQITNVKFITKVSGVTKNILNLVKLLLLQFFLWSNEIFYHIDYIVFYCLSND